MSHFWNRKFHTTKMKTSRDFGVIWEQNVSIKTALEKVVTFPPNRKLASKQISVLFNKPTPNPCRVEIKSGTQSKRCEIDRLLTKDFTQTFKKRYRHKRKSRMKSKKIPPKRSKSMKNLPKIWVHTNNLIFWRSCRGGKICIFPWRSIWTDIFWRSLEENFFPVFFLMSFFLRPRRKYIE